MAAIVAVAGLVFSLLLGGGAPKASAPGIPDPGPVTGWGITTLQMLAMIVSVLVIGLLFTATFLLPNDGPRLRGLAARAVQHAGRFAWVWAALTVGVYFFTASDLFAVSLADAFDWPMLSGMTKDSGLGRALVAQFVIAVVIALASRWIVSVRLATGLLVLAVIGLWPNALSGHASSAGSHDLAVVSLFVHTLAAALWVGGLCGLLWVAWRGSRRLPDALARYSTLILWSVIALITSGLINAALRFSSPGDLLSPYGALLAVKAALLALLLLLGGAQRSQVVARLRQDPAHAGLRGRRFIQLAGIETVLMAAVIGVSAGLSRTPFPASEEVLVTPAEALLGAKMPPEPTVWRLIWGFYPSGVGITLLAVCAFGYAAGVIALRRRGDKWPVGRTISWFVGLVVLLWSMLGGLGVYSHAMFSVHMVAHMVIAMVAPIFLVLAAPMTLALRTLPGPRRPGEVSPRKLLNDFLHSRFAAIVTHPVVAAFLFVGSLYAVYFTDLFDALMRSHWGHVGMEVHFLGSGLLFYYVIIGVDPSPRRLPPIARFGVLMFTIPFHAFFAIGVMSYSTPIAGGFYRAIERPYATDLLEDQYLAGSMTWALGEVPLVIVMAALFVQWVRTDSREAKRHDRSEARTGGAELAAYNEYLASLRRADAESEGRR